MSVMDFIDGCEFCDGFPTDAVPYIFESENFIVKADRSPLLVGHVLVFSKAHFGCAGEIPEALRGELLDIVSSFSKKIQEKYGSVSLYEHGRAGHCVVMESGKGMCEHFHLHILPFNNKVNMPFELESEVCFGHQVENSFSAVFDFFERYGNYLYVSNASDEHSFYAVDPSEIAPHFLRSCFIRCGADSGRDDWLACQNVDEQRRAYENIK